MLPPEAVRLPVTLPSAPLCMLNVAAPVSLRLPMWLNEPLNRLSVPWLAPVRLYVWPPVVSIVPVPVSFTFSNEVQDTVPLLPAFSAVRLYVWLLPLMVSLLLLPVTLVMPLQPPSPVLAAPLRLNVT